MGFRIGLKMCSKNIFFLPLVSGLGCPRIWVLMFLCARGAGDGLLGALLLLGRVLPRRAHPEERDPAARLPAALLPGAVDRHLPVAQPDRAGRGRVRVAQPVRTQPLGAAALQELQHRLRPLGETGKLTPTIWGNLIIQN